ncbi:MAG: AraC family transcriptional regulator, partial [Clostridia bacterium]|nr:AraC family transcriptional regulator [Clostridia bacterium]
KKTCGYSPIAYANFLRCDSAREILLTTDFTPKEVIEACGFYSMSHFKNMYKKLTGRDALADASTVPVEIKVR